MQCQQFGGYVTVEYVSLYLIYHANNWRMNVSCRVSVCPSGTVLGMYIYDNIYLYWIYASNHLGSICQLNVYVDIGYIMPTLEG